MSKFNSKYLEDYAEGIDAAMFSGDAFHDEADRSELRRLMARWERGLQEFDRQEEIEDDDSEGLFEDDARERQS